MAKKENSKIPGNIDLKALIAKGKEAENSFKQDAIEKIENQPKPQAEEKVMVEVTAKETLEAPIGSEGIDVKKEDTTEPLENEQPAISHLAAKDTPKQAKGIKNKNSGLFAFEEFLKPCNKTKNQQYTAGYITNENMKVFRLINAIEGVNITDLLNNITSAWIEQYKGEIVNSIQGAKEF